MFLQAYDFQVIYVQGKTNLAADALSRHPLPNEIASFTTINWVEAQSKGSDIQAMKSNI